MRKIILGNDIEVLVSSYGGVGTTFIMEFLKKYKKVNDYYDSDGLKHSPLPPISYNRNIKYVYIYGDPIMATVSLFRRNYQNDQSKKLLGYINSNIKPIPKDMTLEEYASEGVDRFLFRENFYNWYEKYLYYPTLFVKYDKIFEVADQLLEFLELPKSSIADFPNKKKRNSSLQNTSAKTIEGLNQLYGSFNSELENMDDFEIRIPIKIVKPLSLFLKQVYFKALLSHIFWIPIGLAKRNEYLYKFLLYIKPKG